MLGYLATYNPHLSDLTLALREVVLEEAPDAVESISRGYALAIGFSFTGNLCRMGCCVVTYETHVSFGFNRGALLADPNGIRAGTGKLICLSRSPTRTHWNPAIRRYLQAAIEQVGGPADRRALARSSKSPNPRRTASKGSLRATGAIP